MRHSKAGIAAVAAAVLAGVALAPQVQAKPMMSKPAMKSGATKKGLSQLDKDFMKAVNETNNAERAYVPVVMKRSTNAKVKQFGNTMIKDHTEANQALVKLATSKGVKLPHDVPAKEQAVIKRLSRETGSKFDKAYQHEMIRDHTADMGAFKREISLGRDASVKGFAVKYLPVIEHHLMMAKTMLPAAPAKMAAATMKKMPMAKTSSSSMMKKK